MVDIERLTNYSQEILMAAGACMNRFKNAQIQPEHIMLAMIEDKGIARDYLSELKLINQDFINAITLQISQYPTLSVPPQKNDIYLSDDTKKMLTIADQISQDLKDEFISIEVILLSMTQLAGTEIQKRRVK